VQYEENVAEVGAGESGTYTYNACHCMAIWPLEARKSLVFRNKFEYWTGYTQTAEASTTLLCLNGLKSSFTFTTGPFLIGRVPKNGLWAVEIYRPNEH
jgi:hypothetical protein